MGGLTGNINNALKRTTNALTFRNPKSGIGDEPQNSTTLAALKVVQDETLTPQNRKDQLDSRRQELFAQLKDPKISKDPVQTASIQRDLTSINSAIAELDKKIADIDKTMPIEKKIYNSTPSSVMNVNDFSQGGGGTITEPSWQKIERLQRARDIRNSVLGQPSTPISQSYSTTTPATTTSPTTTSRSKSASSAPEGMTSRGAGDTMQVSQAPQITYTIADVGKTGPNGGILEMQGNNMVERVIQPSTTDSSGRQKAETSVIIPLVTTAAGAFIGSVVPGLGTAAGAVVGMGLGTSIAGYLNTKEQSAAVRENQANIIKAYEANQVKLEEARKIALAQLNASTNEAEYAINAAQLDAITALQAGQNLSTQQVASLNGFINDYSGSNVALADDIKNTFKVQEDYINTGVADAANTLLAGGTAANTGLAKGLEQAGLTLLEGQSAAGKNISDAFVTSNNELRSGFAGAQKNLGALNTNVQQDLTTGGNLGVAGLNTGYQQGLGSFNQGELIAGRTLTTAGQTAGNQITQGYDNAIETLKTALSNSTLNAEQQMDVINRGSNSPYYTEALKGFQAFANSALNPNSEIVQRRINTQVAEIAKQASARGITGGALQRLISDATQKITDEEATKQVGYQKDLASFGIQQQQLDQTLNEARAKILASSNSDKTALLQNISQAQANKGIQTAGITTDTAKLLSGVQQTGATQRGQAQIEQAKAVSDAIMKTYTNAATMKAELGKLGIQLTADEAQALSAKAQAEGMATSGLTERTANALADVISSTAAKASANQMTISQQLAQNQMNAGITNAANLGQTRGLYTSVLSDALKNELDTKVKGALTLSGNADLYATKTADTLTRGGETLANLYSNAGSRAAGITTGTATQQVDLTTNAANSIASGNAALAGLSTQGNAYLANAVTAPMIAAANVAGTTSNPNGTETTQSANNPTAMDRVRATYQNWTGTGSKLTNSPSFGLNPNADYNANLNPAPVSNYQAPIYTPPPIDVGVPGTEGAWTPMPKNKPTISSNLPSSYTGASNQASAEELAHIQAGDEFIPNIGWVKKGRRTISSGLVG